MKKILIVVLILALASFLLVGCGKKDDNFDTINVVVPDGAPALALAKLMHDNPTFEGYNINYKIVGGADNISASVLSGYADIALLPTNLAANLYNQGIDIKITAVNVFGLLYLLGKEDISSVSDLKGKVVYNIAQGGTPDFVFQTILDQNNVKYEITDEPKADEVGLNFVANAQELIQKMVAGIVDFALLGEPQVTQAVEKTKGMEQPFKLILNLQDEWVNGYPQVATVAKATLIADHSDFIDLFLEEMSENVAWVTENVDKAQSALKKYDSNVTFVDSNSIERCNIRLEKAYVAKEKIENYLELMYNFDKKFVGGKLPNDGLYYIANEENKN